MRTISAQRLARSFGTDGHTQILLLLYKILFRKLKDPDLNGIFSTGTDEHGMKVQQAAQKTGNKSF